MKRKRLPLNFWERLDALPPFVVRLLAKNGRARPLAEQAMSDEEIAEASGLAAAVIRLISSRTDWSGVDVPHARAFLSACHADPGNSLDMERISQYLTCKRKPRWKYIMRSPHYTSTFKPLLKLYAKK